MISYIYQHDVAVTSTMLVTDLLRFPNTSICVAFQENRGVYWGIAKSVSLDLTNNVLSQTNNKKSSPHSGIT